MNTLRKVVLPIFLATLWISVSEFFRNEILVKESWENHYQAMGLKFPSEPINGAVWGVWSMLFAIAIYILSRRFNLIQTTFLSWFMAFLMMWVVVGNMDVLPFKILYWAVPLSLLEAFIASLIIKRLAA
jgi:hypothetical protein